VDQAEPQTGSIDADGWPISGEAEGSGKDSQVSDGYLSMDTADH
jgi:hypothetical protein